MARLTRRQKEQIVQQTLQRLSPAAGGSATPPAVPGVASYNGRVGAVIPQVTDEPVFVASGASHAPGAVPDPGITPGTTKFLREDATWQAPTAVAAPHHATHESGGTDEVSVAGLLGVLANPQPPIIGATGTTAVAGNDARLTDARTPTVHAATHKSGGSDAIKLDELAAPTDVTTLNASLTAHGLLQKLPGGTATFLRADGSFAAPVGAAPALSTAEVNLGSAPNARRNGHVQITGLSGLTVGKPVLVTQAPGPYTGKGTRADEAEMDAVQFIGNVLSATVIDLYWQAVHMVRGNFKVQYLVGA